jgi:hypothetical protein
MAHYEDVKTIPIAYIGLISVLVTIVIVMFLQVMFYHHRDNLTANRPGDGSPVELADVIAKQQTMLTRREMVDKERGIVTVGVSRAMELVFTELASGKSPKDVIGPMGEPSGKTESGGSTTAVDGGGEKTPAEQEKDDAEES